MTEQVCEGCRWWQNDQHAIGACMRYPPGVSELVPKTHATDWCGEWADTSLTPEQAKQHELTEKFATALAAASWTDPHRVWELAKKLADAKPQIQRENEQ